MIKVQYYGRLKERLAVEKEEIEWDSGDINALLAMLRGRNELWCTELAEEQVFRVVINHEIVFDHHRMIEKGDEIGILPPVTGG